MSASCAIQTDASRSTRSRASGTPPPRTCPTRRSGSAWAPTPRCASGASWATRWPTAAPSAPPSIASRTTVESSRTRWSSGSTPSATRPGCDWTWRRRCARSGPPSTRAWRPSCRRAGRWSAGRSRRSSSSCRIDSPPTSRSTSDSSARPLEFGSLASSFLLRSEDLARRVAVADQTLVGYLETLADQKLASIGTERSLRERVRRALWSELSERTPTLEGVARSLGVSARTLQRQLRQEGVSFAKLLAELRREMAPSLLRDGAARCFRGGVPPGLRGSSAFRRAFQRWFGRSPRSFRSATG